MEKQIIKETKESKVELPKVSKGKDLIVFNPRGLKRSLKSIIDGKKKGIKVLGRVLGQYSDDYSLDKVRNFGKTVWKPVKIIKETDKRDDKYLNITEYEFKNGNFWQEPNGIVNMSFVNDNYEFITYVE